MVLAPVNASQTSLSISSDSRPTPVSLTNPMKPRVLLLGSAGQLGVESQKLLSSAFELTALSRAHVDLTNESQLRGAVIAANPQFIVNAAAYTAVDRAESEP